MTLVGPARQSDRGAPQRVGRSSRANPSPLQNLTMSVPFDRGPRARQFRGPEPDRDPTSPIWPEDNQPHGAARRVRRRGPACRPTCRAKHKRFKRRHPSLPLDSVEEPAPALTGGPWYWSGVRPSAALLETSSSVLPSPRVAEHHDHEARTWATPGMSVIVKTRALPARPPPTYSPSPVDLGDGSEPKEHRGLPAAARTHVHRDGGHGKCRPGPPPNQPAKRSGSVPLPPHAVNAERRTRGLMEIPGFVSHLSGASRSPSLSKARPPRRHGTSQPIGRLPP